MIARGRAVIIRSYENENELCVGRASTEGPSSGSEALATACTAEGRSTQRGAGAAGRAPASGRTDASVPTETCWGTVWRCRRPGCRRASRSV